MPTDKTAGTIEPNPPPDTKPISNITFVAALSLFDTFCYSIITDLRETESIFVQEILTFMYGIYFQECVWVCVSSYDVQGRETTVPSKGFPTHFIFFPTRRLNSLLIPYFVKQLEV